MAPEATGFIIGILVSAPALYVIAARAYSAGHKSGTQSGHTKGFMEGIKAQIEKVTSVKLGDDLSEDQVEEMFNKLKENAKHKQ